MEEFRETVAATPVVLYALEWCEFCWSVRRMFQEAGIEYLSIDLDSAAYRENNRGGRMRAVLREVTGSPTIPQVFIGGEYLGGATETFDAYNSGKLKEMLDQQSIAMLAAKENAYGYLPTWLHPR
ncbi:MAG: glutaredoxin domain-containing protein [Paracoccaceae bacterium]